MPLKFRSRLILKLPSHQQAQVSAQVPFPRKSNVCFHVGRAEPLNSPATQPQGLTLWRLNQAAKGTHKQAHTICSCVRASIQVGNRCCAEVALLQSFRTAFTSPVATDAFFCCNFAAWNPSRLPFRMMAFTRFYGPWFFSFRTQLVKQNHLQNWPGMSDLGLGQYGGHMGFNLPSVSQANLHYRAGISNSPGTPAGS